jgi:L,D-transpeptidase catalytic domain/Putative peptidoglycan binding domain
VYEYDNKGDVLAQRMTSVFTTALGIAAVLVAIVAPPAEAKKSAKQPEKLAEVIADPDNGEPLTLVVSLRDQQLDIYRGLTLIANSRVSSGTAAYPTKTGVFSILEKQRYHHSNMYSAAPMPWMQRLTWSGTALHAGVVPGYPASHGCIRLPFSFAPKLFQITTGGENVIVTSDRAAPKPVENPALFQPSNPSATNEQSTNAIETSAPRDSTPPLSGTAEDPDGPPASTGDGTGVSLTGESNAIDTPSPAPLRILVTRRTERDRIISIQYMLSSMGYLAPQKFSGRLGNATVAAIKAFQKANARPETGAFTADLAKKVYEVAGREEPPDGHLFVRHDFKPVFDTPVAIRNPEHTLGMHVFTAIFAPGDLSARWMAISLEGGDALSTLDRIEIPNAIRQSIEDKLTPGSSLIISDGSKDSAILPDGGDFIVLAKSTPAVAETPKPKPKHVTIGKPKPSFSRRWNQTGSAYANDYFRSFDQPKRSFFRWRGRR